MPFNLPRVTKVLLIANLVAYLLQCVVGEQAYAFLELWPYVPDAPEQWFMPWQLLPISGVAVVLICVLSSILCVRRVIVLEPAVVFRG